MKARKSTGPRSLFPPSLSLSCQSRWPIILSDASRQAILDAPLPRGCSVSAEASIPTASVIVPTHHQEALTRLCLGSVLTASRPASFELIVVDNGSTDGTAPYLRELARLNPCVRLVLNPKNRGFAAAINQGLEIASGGILILLNNDTIVCHGWLEKLALRLLDPAVGMTGCLTNRSGGENEIDTTYSTYGQFVEFSERIAHDREQDFEVEMLPLSCAALRRDVFDRVGVLDEGYGQGLFEDDDLSLRLTGGGYRILVAGDCYIHHFGQASMGDAAHYATLMAKNRKRFERKWDIAWRPREKRPNHRYLQMIERIRAAAGRLEESARVAVVSRGDEALLRLGDVGGAVHFMQDEAGVYWGAHPADSAEAISRWTELEKRGFQYLLVPETSLWWLTFYEAFGEFVEDRFDSVVIDPGTCRLFRLKHLYRVREGGTA